MVTFFYSVIVVISTKYLNKIRLVPVQVLEAVGFDQISHGTHQIGPIAGGVPPCKGGAQAYPVPRLRKKHLKGSS